MMRLSAASAGWRSVASARRMDMTSGVFEVTASQNPTLASGRLGIAECWPSGPLWRGAEWSFALIGLLGYTFVIESLRGAIGTLMMIVAIVGLCVGRERLRLPVPVLLFGALLMWSALCFPFSPYPDVVQAEWVEFAKVWCVALVAGSTLRTWARIRGYMVLLLACFMVYPVRGTLFNYYIYHETMFGRAHWRGLFSNPNDLAGIALLQLSLAAALVAAEKSWWVRAGAFVSMAVIPFLVVLTQSRGALIAMGGALVLSLSGQRRRLRLFGIAALLLAITATVAPSSAFERLEGLRNATSAKNLKEVDPEGSADQRYEIWRVASSIIHDYPLIGVGTGAYPYVHNRYAFRDEFRPTARGRRDTHSTYLNVAAENGIPGLLLLLFLIGHTLWRAARVRKRCEQILPREASQLRWLQQGLIAFLLAGIFGTYVRFPFLYIHLILMWSLAELCDREFTRRVGTRAPQVGAAPRRLAISAGYRNAGGYP